MNRNKSCYKLHFKFLGENIPKRTQGHKFLQSKSSGSYKAVERLPTRKMKCPYIAKAGFLYIADRRGPYMADWGSFIAVVWSLRYGVPNGAKFQDGIESYEDFKISSRVGQIIKIRKYLPLQQKIFTR